MEDHRIAVQRLRAFKHCKIIDRAGLPQRIICKCDILRCQRFPVRKFRTSLADCHRPCQSILRGFHIGSQIITNPQIRRCHRKSTLNQRLMDMFAGPPAIGGVKSRFRFGICCHNNHYRIFLLLCVLCLLLHCRPIGLCRAPSLPLPEPEQPVRARAAAAAMTNNALVFVFFILIPLSLSR